jgi:hypothetical protein
MHYLFFCLLSAITYAKWSATETQQLLLAFNKERKRTAGHQISWENITKNLNRQGMRKPMRIFFRKFMTMKAIFLKALKNNGINRNSTDPYTKVYNETFFSIINERKKRNLTKLYNKIL